MEGIMHVDKDSGRIFRVNPDTGEVREYYNTDVEIGSRIITPDEQERIAEAKKAREQRELMKSWRLQGCNKREKFIFVSTKVDFPGVPPAMVTRLIYLSTYAAYSAIAGMVKKKGDKSLGNPLICNGVPLQRKDLAKVLSISKRHTANFFKAVCPQFIREDEQGNLFLVKGFFSRGGLRKKQFVQYQKVYNNGVRKLYEAANGKYHTQLGYIFMMIPYISVEYNILCWNPMETEMEKVCPISPKEFCTIVGYSLPNLNRLMKVYRSIMFDVCGKREHFCKIVCDWNDQSNAMICINPAVIYSGTGIHHLEIMKLFFNESQATEQNPVRHFCMKQGKT